jgi:hypothetical protein
LAVELIAENDLIFELFAQCGRVRIPRAPELHFSQEVNPALTDDPCRWAVLVRSEEIRCPKDPLESLNKSPLILSALLYSKRLEHLGGTLEPQHRTLLPDRHDREKDRHDPVLTEGNAELRMAGHLERKPPVPTFVE